MTKSRVWLNFVYEEGHMLDQIEITQAAKKLGCKWIGRVADVDDEITTEEKFLACWRQPETERRQIPLVMHWIFFPE